MVQQTISNNSTTVSTINMRSLERKVASLEKERDGLKDKIQKLEKKAEDLQKEAKEKEREYNSLKDEKTKVEQELLVQKAKDGNARFVAILVFIASILTELLPLIFKAMGFITP